ncbi:unnamed protein product [Pedinophyceae sp. YPF-701]|nr:unnamed protein product [Pedinophyceae sp. YPF-701]
MEGVCRTCVASLPRCHVAGVRARGVPRPRLLRRAVRARAAPGESSDDVVTSKQRKQRLTRSMDALDAMLPDLPEIDALADSIRQEAADRDAGGSAVPKTVLYDRKPISTVEQEAPGRKQGMDGGKEGRYLDPDAITRGSAFESRAGRATKDGEELDVPTYEPRLAYVALAANLAVYLGGVAIALTAGNDASNDYFFALAKDDAAVAGGEFYRLLTANFLHAGVLHLGLNSVALWQLAPEAEAVLGPATFATVYLLSGAAGSVASMLFSDLTSVGASGAIFGLLGALIGYFAQNPKLARAPQQALFLAALAGGNLFLGTAEGSMIDNAGHVGGLLMGAWLGYAMGPSLTVLKEIDIPAGSLYVPEGEEEVETVAVVDRRNAIGKAAVGVSAALSLGVVAALAVALQNEAAAGL